MSGFCTLCGFRVASFEGLKCCPRCGHKGIPCSDHYQQNVSINLQELRVLCMWAENWAHAHKEENPTMLSVVYGIAHRLRQQLVEGTCLTMSDEFEQLRKAGYDFETNHPSEDI